MFHFFQCFWSSEKQFGMIRAEMGSIHPTAFWTFELGPCFFVSRLRTSVQCVICHVVWWKGMVFPMWWTEVKSHPPPQKYEASLKFWCYDFKAHKVMKIKLLRIGRGRGWESSFFMHFWARLLLECVMQSLLSADCYVSVTVLHFWL
jgi:hypothetical protein